MPELDRLILGSTLRQHIGGRWAISVIGVAVATPLGLVTSGANVSSVQGTQTFGQWLAIGVVGSLVIIGVLWIANITLFRNRRVHPVPIAWVIALGATAGAARSLVVVPLSAELGVIDFRWSEFVLRLISGAAIGALFLPLAALLSSVVASYVVQRRDLVAELRDLEVDRMRRTGEIDALRETVLDELREQVGEVVESRDPEMARRVSHRIWEQSEGATSPRVSWRDVLWATLAHNPYPTLVVAGLWSVSAFGSIVVTAGLVTALVQIGLSVLVFAVVFRAARSVTERVPQFSVAILLLVMVVLDGVVGLALPVILQEDPLRENGAALIANAIWIPVLILMAGGAVSAVRSGDDVVRRLRARVATNQTAAQAQEAEIARIRKEVATALHGTVQSQLLAAAAGLNQPRIAHLMERDPAAGLEQALASVTAGENAATPVDVQIARIMTSWGSLMDIQVVGIDELAASPQAEAAVRVIEEGLSNAFRHGHASAVDVTITRHDAGLLVSVIDDGDGPPVTLTSGLGTSVLESIAPGAWSLTRTDGRTVLDVQLTRGGD